VIAESSEDEAELADKTLAANVSALYSVVITCTGTTRCTVM